MTQTLRLAGFATRAIALAIDAAIVNVVAAATGLIVALGLGLFGVDPPTTEVRAALGATGWLLVVGVYFIAFWMLAGQTPGMRFMGVRVIMRSGPIPTWHCAVVRFGGMVLSAIPFGAGFLLVAVDDQRRGLHDRLAGTLVVHGGDPA